MNIAGKFLLAVSACVVASGLSAAPFQDAQNRVWYLSISGGYRYNDMAQNFDPISGYALNGSGSRWATRAEVLEFTSQIGQVSGQDFFDRYPCTYFEPITAPVCNPTIGLWTSNPGYGPSPSGFAVFGGVVRDSLNGASEQTNVYVRRNFQVIGYGSVPGGPPIPGGPGTPPDQWYIQYSPLSSYEFLINSSYGETTQRGQWTYVFVPAPQSLALLALGLVGIGVARRKRA